MGAVVTVFRLGRALTFPDPRLSESDGLLAVGGDLEPDRLLLAYRLGIFPWYGPNNPRLWWSPDPRMVLPCEELHVPRSLAKRMRRGDYRVTTDTAFAEVVERCAKAERPGQDGTWIVPEMRRAYVKLHELGYAHSFEAWAGDVLVGGLYGVGVGDLFCGESMFADAPDASKVAFVRSVELLRGWGFELIDCQVHTEHLARFGAREVSREWFLPRAMALAARPDRRGRWSAEPSVELAAEQVDQA